MNEQAVKAAKEYLERTNQKIYTCAPDEDIIDGYSGYGLSGDEYYEKNKHRKDFRIIEPENVIGLSVAGVNIIQAPGLWIEERN